MGCSILALYAEEEESAYSIDEVNLTLKAKKKSKKPKKLSDGAIRLYERIVFRSQIHGYCWELDKTFAKEFDVSIETIKRRMKQLREFGMIRCESRVVNLLKHRKIYPFSKNVCGRVKNDTSGRVKNDPHKHIPIKEEQNNKELAAVSLEDEENAKKMFEASESFAKNRSSIWRMPQKLFLRLILDHGMGRVVDNASHMCNQQQRAEKDEFEGKYKKTPKVNDPKKYLVMACAQNWAMSVHNKGDL